LHNPGQGYTIPGDVEYIIKDPLNGYTVTDEDEVLDEETFSLM
jgi:hypothetical protein